MLIRNSKRRFLSRSLTATVVMLAFAGTAAAESVLNGDCELGTWGSGATAGRLTNWTFAKNAGTDGNWYYGKTTGANHTEGGTGSGGGRITNGTGKSCTFSQSVSGLTPGGNYNVSAWLRANTASAGSSVTLGARTGGDEGYTWSEADTDNTFTEYTVAATASDGGVVDVQINILVGAGHSSQSCGFFDDVTITPACTPPAVPGQPTVDNATVSSLDVTLNTGDSDSDYFAIRINGGAYTNKYVQADGSVGDGAAWQTKATWGTVTVGGLWSYTTYTFDVKSDADGTGFCPSGAGTSAQGQTLCATPDAPTEGAHLTLNAAVIWKWSTVGGATAYRLWDSASGGNQIGSDLTTTSYFQTGLTAGTSYTVYVESDNGCATSSRTALNATTTNTCIENPGFDAGTYTSGLAFGWTVWAGTPGVEITESTTADYLPCAVGSSQGIKRPVDLDARNGVYQQISVTSGAYYNVQVNTNTGNANTTAYQLSVSTTGATDDGDVTRGPGLKQYTEGSCDLRDSSDEQYFQAQNSQITIFLFAVAYAGTSQHIARFDDVRISPGLSAIPVDASKCPGETATFSVTASDEGSVSTYQWEKWNGNTSTWDALADGDDISGATTDELTIATVDTTDAGEYRCVVTGDGSDCGGVIAPAATLTVRDTDGDGVCDDNDNCPDDANAGQEDADNDGVGDVCDNCPSDPNPGQEDADSDGVGDVCDGACPDADSDGVCDADDNCPNAPNPEQTDADSDGYGAACDCSDEDDAINPGATETCDALDNDCDGATDEDFPEKGSACSAGIGACEASGVRVCRPDGTGTICDAVPGNPTSETCDALDNDCDGATDEDFPEKGSACSAGIGACETSGVRVCRPDGTGTICDAVPGEPASEVCDGVDNDCDGEVDEGVCEPLAVVSSVSRKSHGTYGDFDVTSGSWEGRVPTTSLQGPSTIMTVFNQPIQRVNNNSSDVSVSSGTVSSIGVAGDTLTVSLTGIAPKATFTIGYPGIAAAYNIGQTTTETSCWQVLPGEASGGDPIVVNTSDFVYVRGRIGMAISSNTFRADVNADGAINTSDFVAIRGRIDSLFSMSATCP